MYYANLYNLKPGDRIVCEHSQFPILKHHVIYLGIDNFGNEWIAENHKFSDVQVIRATDFFTPDLIIHRTEIFKGSRYDRILAVQKALDLVGKPYSLINYNCESFANEVQYNNTKSSQVETAVVLGLAALFIGLVWNAE